MSDQEASELFIRRVSWLKKNLSYDEIYEFAEQALTCADFFLGKWNEWEDIADEVNKNTTAGQWIKNLVGLRILEKKGYEGRVNVVMKTKKEI